MNGRRGLLRCVAVAAVAVVALPSCGGDSGGPGPTTTVSPAAADGRHVERVVLSATDLTGFHVEQNRHPSAAPMAQAFSRCDVPPFVLVDPANPRVARGADLADHNARLASMSFAVAFAREEEAAEALALVRRTFDGSCLAGALRTGFQAFGGTDVAIRPFELRGTSGETVARRLLFTRTVDKEQSPSHVDFVYLRDGRFVAGLVVAGYVGAFPTAERVRLVQLVGARLRADPNSFDTTATTPPTTTTLRVDQFQKTPDVVGMPLPRARAAMLDAGFILVKASDGTGMGRIPASDDATWTVRAQSPAAGSPLPQLADVVLILDVVRPGERYAPGTSPCPPRAQC